jgi:hypothetical protein
MSKSIFCFSPVVNARTIRPAMNTWFFRTMHPFNTTSIVPSNPLQNDGTSGPKSKLEFGDTLAVLMRDFVGMNYQ